MIMKYLNLAVMVAVLGAARSVASAQESTRVVLDAAATGGTISPLLFGHNLEITRRGIWQGLSAEMVANRKFAAAENGQPKRWSAINGGGPAVIDDNFAYAGRQSVRITVAREGKAGGISQVQSALALRKEAHYVLRLWLKTAQARTVKAGVSDGSGKQVFFEREWGLKPGPWQLVTAEFAASITGESNRLEISSQAAGEFWIGAVSLQPANTFHGMRRDVVDLLKRIKPGSLRYPGGCYAEFYRWQEGLLPVDQRPPIGPTGLSFLLPDNDDYDAHEIGTDEFLALCREIGCEPAITVRLSENMPGDAAAWVEYCNGATDTKWGRIRAERGHAASYQVQCWFVGNELYSFGRGGLNKSEIAARQTRLFASAMKKVDPDLRLTGCSHYGKGDWNRRLIGEAGELLDLFSAHDYLLDHFKGELSGIARAPTQNLRPLLQNARASLQRDLPAGRRFGIAFDEWNTLWGRPGSVGMGLYAAGVLNFLGREGASLGIERAYYFMPINEGAIRVTPLTASLDDAGDVFELYQVHQANRRLLTPEMPPDADLDLCASITPGGGQVYVSLVNRSTNDEQTVALELRHFARPLESAVKFLIPPTLDANAHGFRQVSSTPRVRDDQSVEVKIPPGAIGRVRFGKARPRE